LEEEASIKLNQPQKEVPPILEPKPKSVVQIVFEENKVWCHYCKLCKIKYFASRLYIL